MGKILDRLDEAKKEKKGIERYPKATKIAKDRIKKRAKNYHQHPKEEEDFPYGASPGHFSKKTLKNKEMPKMEKTSLSKMKAKPKHAKLSDGIQFPVDMFKAFRLVFQRLGKKKGAVYPWIFGFSSGGKISPLIFTNEVMRKDKAFHSPFLALKKFIEDNPKLKGLKGKTPILIMGTQLMGGDPGFRRISGNPNMHPHLIKEANRMARGFKSAGFAKKPKIVFVGSNKNNSGALEVKGDKILVYRTPGVHWSTTRQEGVEEWDNGVRKVHIL